MQQVRADPVQLALGPLQGHVDPVAPARVGHPVQPTTDVGQHPVPGVDHPLPVGRGDRAETDPVVQQGEQPLPEQVTKLLPSRAVRILERVEAVVRHVPRVVHPALDQPRVQEQPVLVVHRREKGQLRPDPGQQRPADEHVLVQPDGTVCFRDRDQAASRSYSAAFCAFLRSSRRR